jgi:glycosyltransferase involved in cell wall biosynthesis
MPSKLGHLNRSFYFKRYLEKLGHKVTVFVDSYLHNNDDGQMIKAGKIYSLYDDVDSCVFVKICNYKTSKFKRFYAMWQYHKNLLKIADKFEKPDVIIGELFAGVTAIKLSRKYKCKNIIEIRDLWPETFVMLGLLVKENPIIKVLYQLEKWMYIKSDKIIFTMEGGKDYIKEKRWDKSSGGKIDLKKLYHINNGVDLNQFNYNRYHFKIKDEDLENKDIFKVVYTGSIRMINDLGVLVNVAKKFKENGYNRIKLLIWGTGNELETLRRRIKYENLDNIIFKGQIKKKFIPYILSNSDINILHSTSDIIAKYGSSENKTFDYLAAGKPILRTSNINYDFLLFNGAALAVEQQNVDNIYEAILDFYNMPKDRYNEMCKNSLNLAKEYDFKKLTDKLIKVIED